MLFLCRRLCGELKIVRALLITLHVAYPGRRADACSAHSMGFILGGLVLQAYQRRTVAADALIAGCCISGTNTRRVRRALRALFGGAVGRTR